MKVKHILALAVVTVALSAGVRIAFIAESRHFPDFRTLTPGMDTDLHWNAARLMNSENTGPLAFEVSALSAPTNGVLLRLSQRALGEDLMAHRFFYTLLSCLSSALLFFLALRVSKSLQAAFVAALLFSIQPTWVYLSTLPLKTTLTVGFAVAMLWTAYEIGETLSLRASMLLAVLHAHLACLLFLTQRNTVVLCLGSFAYTVLARSGRQRRAWITLVQVSSLMVLSLLASVFWQPRWVSYPQAGIHIRVGNHRGATGAYSAIPGIPPTPIGHTFVARMAAEIEAGVPMSPADADRHHLVAALRWMRENPGDFAHLAGRKVMLFFNDYAPNENYFLTDLTARSRVLRTIPVGFGLLIVAAALGCVALARDSRWNILFLLGGAVGSVLVVNVASFVTSRYRISAMPPLAILGGIGIVFAYRQMRAVSIRKPKALQGRLLTVVLPVGAAALLTFAPVVSNEEQVSSMKTAAANLNRSRAAEKTLERLNSIESSATQTPQSTKEKAFLLLRLQRLTEAYRLLEELAQSPTADPQVLRQYLAMTIVAGNYDQAALICARCRQEFGWTDHDLVRGQEEAVRAILIRFILPRS